MAACSQNCCLHAFLIVVNGSWRTRDAVRRVSCRHRYVPFFFLRPSNYHCYLALADISAAVFTLSRLVLTVTSSLLFCLFVSSFVCLLFCLFGIYITIQAFFAGNFYGRVREVYSREVYSRQRGFG